MRVDLKKSGQINVFLGQTRQTKWSPGGSEAMLEEIEKSGKNVGYASRSWYRRWGWGRLHPSKELCMSIVQMMKKKVWSVSRLSCHYHHSSWWREDREKGTCLSFSHLKDRIGIGFLLAVTLVLLLVLLIRLGSSSFVEKKSDQASKDNYSSYNTASYGSHIRPAFTIYSQGWGWEWGWEWVRCRAVLTDPIKNWKIH